MSRSVTARHARRALLPLPIALLAGCASSPRATFDPGATLPSANGVAVNEARRTPQEPAPPRPLTSVDYLVPAADIVVFDLLLNQFNRQFSSDDSYDSDWASIRHNLRSGWVVDNDPFATNQFLHPYQGAMYHAFARSAGLGYWTSLGYDFVGSALWEIAGETVPPSVNDQITTTFGGSFLGEVLFRMSNHVLEGGGDSPSFGRGLAAAAISPATGFNRLAYGDRYDAVYDSHAPAVYSRVGVGARRNEKISDVGVFSSIHQDEAVADFVMDYGLPGKSGYTYDRPFDYFHFEVAAVSSSNALPEDVMIRGLLYGSTYDIGPDYRGVWGLYGGYDYISPEVFSVSSTSLSVGSTAQWRLADALNLQGTCLGGVGWAAAGTVADAESDRDYHYGVSPQGLAALRVLFGDVCVFDMTGREFYLISVHSGGREDHENILRGKAALTARVYGNHCLGVQYVASSRDAAFTDTPDQFQSIGAFSVFYTFVSDQRFGAVDWQ